MDEKEAGDKPSCTKRITDKNFLKGISTVFRAILVSLVSGIIFGVINIMVYQVSYIRGVDPDNFISLDHLAFYYPFEVLFQCLSSFLSGILDKKIRLHFTNLIGFIVLDVGFFTLFLSENFYIDILSMILCGIGTGIIYYP